MRRALSILLLAALPAMAADSWARATTEHFEVVAESGEKSARDMAVYFEQVRSFFVKVSPLKPLVEFPIRIILFRNESKLQQGRAAFHTATPVRDTIVMQESDPESRSAAVHEFIHVIVRRCGLTFGTWMLEGWASAWSTMIPQGGSVLAGTVIPNYLALLQEPRTRYLDLRTLVSIDAKSPLYNEVERSGTFYAETWALLHMLSLSSPWDKNFARFTALLQKGIAPAEAVTGAFNRTPLQLIEDLKAYVTQNRFQPRALVSMLESTEALPLITAMSDYDLSLVFADVLTSAAPGPAVAAEFSRLMQLDPTRADTVASAGFLALQLRDGATALADFEKAFALGSTDPQVGAALALMLLQSKQPAEKYLAAMEMAVKGKPKYNDWRVQLGLMQMEGRRFEECFATLMALDTIPPARAPAVFAALAYSAMEMGHMEEARARVATARQWAKQPAEIQTVTRINGLLDARSSGPFAVRPNEKMLRVTGTASDIVCTNNTPRLFLTAEGREVVLDLPPGPLLEFSRPAGGQFDMKCGQLNASMYVEYGAPGLTAGSQGIVRRIELRN